MNVSVQWIPHVYCTKIYTKVSWCHYLKPTEPPTAFPDQLKKYLQVNLNTFVIKVTKSFHLTMAARWRSIISYKTRSYCNSNNSLSQKYSKSIHTFLKSICIMAVLSYNNFFNCTINNEFLIGFLKMWSHLLGQKYTYSSLNYQL